MGGQEKACIGCFLDDVSVWYQRRPVNDYCSPGRGEMTQDGGSRGGTFHGEMDHHRRESQGWTTVCSRMLERERKDRMSW